MRRDPGDGRLYVEVADLAGFHTRRGLPSLHLTEGRGRAVCGRLAETVTPAAELPPFDQSRLCQACVQRVWGWVPAIVRWWETERSKEGANA